MVFRRNFKSLMAFVLLVAAALTAPMAMAAPMAPTGHSMDAMAGDCAFMPAMDRETPAHHEGADESCCAATCLGTAIVPPFAIGLGLSAQQPILSAVKTFSGVLSEIATPPPRLA